MQAEPQTEPGEIASELVQRITAGDQRAEAELVELYSRGISYMLRRLTGNRQLSEDLHQETFHIVLQKVRDGKLREPEKLSGFIRGIARNLMIAERRRPTRSSEADANDAPVEPVDPTASPLTEILRHEERRQVRRLLGELRSERDRQVLFRFHLAEEDKEEICGALGLTSQQFNVVLFRAHQRFRQLLEKTGKRLRLSESGNRLQSRNTIAK